MTLLVVADSQLGGGRDGLDFALILPSSGVFWHHAISCKQVCLLPESALLKTLLSVITVVLPAHDSKLRLNKVVKSKKPQTPNHRQTKAP